jgi:hypothetical protein
MAKTQLRAMEMEQNEAKIVTKRRHVILNRVTLVEKGIKIPNPK